MCGFNRFGLTDLLLKVLCHLGAILRLVNVSLNQKTFFVYRLSTTAILTVKEIVSTTNEITVPFFKCATSILFKLGLLLLPLFIHLLTPQNSANCVNEDDYQQHNPVRD